MTVANDKSSAVLVTGSSTGIGEACALELDRLGYRVFAGVRSEADGQKLKQQAGRRLTPIMLDVTDREMISDALKSIAEELDGSPLVGLVNNAGIVVFGPLETLPLDALREQFEVNVVGQIAVTQACLPMLRAAKGRIVNMSSISGAVASPYLGPYCASKFALEALSDSLRLELRNSGVSVSLIEPVSVATPIWEKSLAKADSLTEQMSPEAIKPYEADLEVIRSLTAELAKGQLTMQKVVDAVVHAISAPRPKPRYYLTIATRMAFRGMQMLPHWVRDGIVLRELKLPK
jgi:NAD(P)-dependent dehydrogenase (short-subunit alcohol dehydrogenase family)